MEETTRSGLIVLSHSNYGKAEVRVVKVVRGAERHTIRDMDVAVALEGDFAAAHTQGDNTGLLATDTVRNTIYALAKTTPVESIEAFGLALVEHFLVAGPTVTGVRVSITEYPWERIVSGGEAHAHSFVRAAGERTAVVRGETGGARSVQSGIDKMTVLKTTNSGWEGFLREQYTTLPDASDRILATVVKANWWYTDASARDYNALWQQVRESILTTFTDHYSPSVQNTLFRMGRAVLETHPEIARIHFSLPNKHHLLYDLGRFGLENASEIFHATNDPYGLIEGTVERQ